MKEMKDALFITGKRNGYHPNQCGRTMTVGELINFLEEFQNKDMEIFIRNDNGYTYGNITEWEILGGWYNEDEVITEG